MTSNIIPILAILSSTYLTDGSSTKVYQGGEKARFALEQCLKDSRPMESQFILRIEEGVQGYYLLNCQMLETTTVPHYAVKGEYIRQPLLSTLIEEFEKKGVRIVAPANQ